MGKVGSWGGSILLHLLPLAGVVWFGRMAFEAPDFGIARQEGTPFHFEISQPVEVQFEVPIELPKSLLSPEPVDEFEREAKGEATPVIAAAPELPMPVLDRPARALAEKVAVPVSPSESVPTVESETVAVEVYNPPPEYPLAARRQKLQGIVVVEVTVLEDGTFGGARIVEDCPYPSFAQSALAAVGQWKFQPATRGGRAVQSTQRIRFIFKLQ